MKTPNGNIKGIFSVLLPIVLTSCATSLPAGLTIHDERICNIANTNDFNAAAACDDIYTSNPQILTEAQWLAKIDADGSEYCMAPQAMSDFKTEIEQACSAPGINCTYDQIQAIQAVFQRILNLRPLN